MRELQAPPVNGKVDFKHLQELNRRLFQEVYAWAGQPREKSGAAKQVYGGEKAYAFVPSPQIDKEARRIFGTLADKDISKASRAKMPYRPWRSCMAS